MGWGGERRRVKGRLRRRRASKRRGRGGFHGEGSMKGWLRRPNPLPPLKPPSSPPSPLPSPNNRSPPFRRGSGGKGVWPGGGVFRGEAPFSKPLLRKAAQHFAFFCLFHRKFRSSFPLLGVLSWNCGRGPPKVRVRVRSTRAPTLRGPLFGPHPSGLHPHNWRRVMDPTWRPRLVGLDVNVVWIGEKMLIESEVRRESTGDGDGKIWRSRLTVLELKK